MSISTIYAGSAGRANERLLDIAGWIYQVRRPYVIARNQRRAQAAEDAFVLDTCEAAVRTSKGMAL